MRFYEKTGVFRHMRRLLPPDPSVTMNVSAPKGAPPRRIVDFQNPPVVSGVTLKRKSLVNNMIFIDHECTRSIGSYSIR